MIAYAQMILRKADKLSYEEYFHVKPFLDKVFSQINNHVHDKKIQQMQYEYDTKLENKRRKAKVNPMPENNRFERSIDEVKEFALKGVMPL